MTDLASHASGLFTDAAGASDLANTIVGTRIGRTSPIV